jgi:hypothetical protein
MSGNDLYGEQFEDYDEALKYVEEDIADEKAYIVRFEGFCADASPPVTITLEPHT